MARSLRLEFSGPLCHVTSRGDRLENIYETDEDRHKFSTLLGDICSHHNWQCHVYGLISKHYHLLIETPDDNLLNGMR
jgi:REP element-mobilizing transposase RayT